MNQSIDTARSFLRQHSHELLTRADVLATGVGFKFAGGKRADLPSIVCSVEKKKVLREWSAKSLVISPLSQLGLGGGGRLRKHAVNTSMYARRRHPCRRRFPQPAPTACS